MLGRLAYNLDLNLYPKNFHNTNFVIYRLFRLLLLPLGKKFSAKFAVNLHWIFRHLAVATSSNLLKDDFLNSRSAIVQGNLFEKYLKPEHFVVDVACGTARFLPLLYSIGISRYVGIDSSETHIDRNQSKYPNSEFILANALDARFIPICDAIIASHFIEHCDSPETFLKDIQDRCKLLFLEVPDFFSDPVNVVSFKLGGTWWTDRDHRREYSEESLDKLLTKCNYQILDKKFSGGTIGIIATPLVTM